VTRPRLLDLFCCAGGAAMGYHRAGFEVTGVDIKPQPHYPFEFHQADAMTYPLDGFDAYHGSPPCQRFSIATAAHAKDRYPDLIAQTRDRFSGTGRPWVIENVPDAPVRPDYKLCGCMFGLPRLKRERWFETSWQGFDLRQPCSHRDRCIAVVDGGVQTWEIRDWGRRIPAAELRPMREAAMGIDWMNRKELAEAIPPAYTEWIGSQLLKKVKGVAA
jgi:DNA (cytosine-5)-methyltransferase 1